MDVHDLERGIAVARAQVHAVADRSHVNAAAGQVLQRLAGRCAG
jgi:hypothetical protein